MLCTLQSCQEPDVYNSRNVSVSYPGQLGMHQQEGHE